MGGTGQPFCQLAWIKNALPKVSRHISTATLSWCVFDCSDDEVFDSLM